LYGGHSIEVDWAIKQLEAMGYLEVEGLGQDTRISLTDKGHQHAYDIMQSQHDMQERLLIMIHYADLAKLAREE